MSIQIRNSAPVDTFETLGEFRESFGRLVEQLRGDGIDRVYKSHVSWPSDIDGRKKIDVTVSPAQFPYESAWHAFYNRYSDSPQVPVYWRQDRTEVNADVDLECFPQLRRLPETVKAELAKNVSEHLEYNKPRVRDLFSTTQNAPAGAKYNALTGLLKTLETADAPAKASHADPQSVTSIDTFQKTMTGHIDEMEVTAGAYGIEEVVGIRIWYPQAAYPWVPKDRMRQIDTPYKWFNFEEPAKLVRADPIFGNSPKYVEEGFNFRQDLEGTEVTTVLPFDARDKILEAHKDTQAAVFWEVNKLEPVILARHQEPGYMEALARSVPQIADVLLFRNSLVGSLGYKQGTTVGIRIPTPEEVEQAQ
ncbi:MAG: hypothetical protein HYS81_04255 [Candidatus Aenigmatarchaeota archaeon]|nr:MAG: hypothetical protein HYS81_04255 [Candidatus Aenigmarchaeota archaeon]